MVRIGIDVGGTFTDFILMNEDDGAIRFFKVPSTPGDPSEAIESGLRQLMADAGVDAREGRLSRPWHDCRDQHRHRAQGRAHRPVDHQGVPRRARTRAAGPAIPSTTTACASPRRWFRASAGPRSTSASARKARRCGRSTRRRSKRPCSPSGRAGRGGRDLLPALLPRRRSTKRKRAAPFSA